MATKDLGRTPLEAGNTAEYHSVRREARRQARHEAKAFCHSAARDPETYEAMPAPVAPEHRRPGNCWPSDMHADAVGPVKRWIHRQVGRRWDDVYSEIRSRFNARTLAGRHIIDGHLLGYVDLHGDRELRDLYVDDDGVLCERDVGYRKYRSRTERKTVSDAALDAWLSGRKVEQRSAMLYWLTPTGNTRREYRKVDRKRADHWGWETVSVPVDVMRYRQGRSLTRKEIAFYERLTSSQRAKASEDLVIEAVAPEGSQRPHRGFFYRVPAPGATPLAVDEAA